MDRTATSIYSEKSALLFYRLMLLACVPAFLLSVLWIHPASWVYLLAAIAGLIQVVALISFWKIIRQCNNAVGKHLSKTTRTLLVISCISFTLKLILQLLSAIPLMAQWAFEIRNLVIEYLHLVLLAFFTLFLFAYFIEEKFLSVIHRNVRWGIGCFVTGILITELLVFGQGTGNLLNNAIPEFKILLAVFSILLPLGLFLILLRQFHR